MRLFSFPDGVRGRCYVHMLNAACLSPFPVPCHRYHLIQELFRGQLFQAIESRSKPALNFSFFGGWGGLCSQLLFSFLSLLRCFFPGSVLRGHKYDHLSWVDLSCKTCNCESFSKYVVFVSKFQTRWESEGEFCTLRFDVSILDGERTQRKPKRKSLLPRGGTYNW